MTRGDDQWRNAGWGVPGSSDAEPTRELGPVGAPGPQGPAWGDSRQVFPRPGGSFPQEPPPEPVLGSSPQGGGSGKGPVILLVILIVLALIALVGVLFWAFGDRGSDEAGGDAPGAGRTSTRVVTSTRSSTVTTEAEEPSIPGAKEVDTGYPVGEYRNVVTTGGVTSDGFAAAVRDAFVEEYEDDGETDVTLRVRSDATHKTYTMSCRDEGDHVHCAGGNNANVHLY